MTVFAPTDAAFNGIGVTEADVGAVDLLAEILTYHAVPGRRSAQSVVNGIIHAIDGVLLP